MKAMGSGFPPAPALCEEGVELETEWKQRNYSENHFKHPSEVTSTVWRRGAGGAGGQQSDSREGRGLEQTV